jgi:hypothetical protein
VSDEQLPQGRAERTVHCADAIAWLEQSEILHGCSLVASMPDISEFPGYTLAEWQNWFTNTAALILSRTPPEGVTIFYQSDIKFEGSWVDKSYLCQKAAEKNGDTLLWHKILCRIAPGQATFGRPGYSHLLCFSKGVRISLEKSSPDVIPDLGEKTWVRGMGLNACRLIAKFIAEQTTTKTLVHPFCGQGSMLAAANAYNLTAIGIERSEKRATAARTLQIDPQWKGWVK